MHFAYPFRLLLPQLTLQVKASVFDVVKKLGVHIKCWFSHFARARSNAHFFCALVRSPFSAQPVAIRERNGQSLPRRVTEVPARFVQRFHGCPPTLVLVGLILIRLVLTATIFE